MQNRVGILIVCTRSRIKLLATKEGFEEGRIRRIKKLKEIDIPLTIF